VAPHADPRGRARRPGEAIAVLEKLGYEVRMRDGLEEPEDNLSRLRDL
jgi:hypothetical protein